MRASRTTALVTTQVKGAPHDRWRIRADSVQVCLNFDDGQCLKGYPSGGEKNWIVVLLLVLVPLLAIPAVKSVQAAKEAAKEAAQQTSIRAAEGVRE